MDLNDMDYILELAQTRNFSRAAENLFISQPSLSYHIRSVETELGVPIFSRSGRGAALTPAGEQFCVTLRNVRQELKAAIEQAQNFGSRYTQAIRVGMSCRSALFHLPEVIHSFTEQHPDVSVTPVFSPDHSLELFLKGETDLLFAMEVEIRQVPEIQPLPLYQSPICLITLPDDPLAAKKRIRMKDLTGHTLMVGGGSPPILRHVQQRVLHDTGMEYFTSADHDTTLTNVAARRGVCLAPGFLNDHNPAFAWIPFDCPETIPCVLCLHRDDRRPLVLELAEQIRAAEQALPQSVT